MAESNQTELDINLLQPNPLQPRGIITPESLVELVDSIREHGVLEPIIVAQTPAGYQIIAGERRWRASKIAGLSQVPVSIKITTPQGMLEMAIVENVQRIDLNPLERSKAYMRLMEEFNLSNQEIAKRVGKSPSYISNTIRLLSLPDALKDALASGATTEGHARALASLEDSHLIVEAYRQVLAKNLSVRATEELTRKLKANNSIEPKTRASIAARHSDEIETLQADLTEKLVNLSSSKAKVKLTQSRVEARIQIVIKGKTDLTSDVLNRISDAILKIS